jgi:hypothetical protein
MYRRATKSDLLVRETGCLGNSTLLVTRAISLNARSTRYGWLSCYLDPNKKGAVHGEADQNKVMANKSPSQTAGPGRG